jgi:putative ABC transport system permease protein
MGYFRFVWAGMWRKKTRALLTILSLICAFLLFGLLQALSVFFTAGVDFVGASRLISQSRVSFTDSLPIRLLPEIEKIPGVKDVSHDQWFGGVIGENTQMFTFASDPARLRLKSNIFPKKDGSMSWPLDIVGIFDGKDASWQAQTQSVYINWAYFSEANQFGPGIAGVYAVVLEDPNRANEVAQAIDARFMNSPNETKTQSEKDFNKGFFAQIGDIGLIVNLILVAVFFTILILTGNTMAQAVRERIPELAVLKTLGFSNGQVTALVLAEALLLCLIGGLIGMGLASLLMAFIASMTTFFAAVRTDGTVWLRAIIAIFVLALAVGLPPALRAGRMRIVDALAGR